MSATGDGVTTVGQEAVQRVANVPALIAASLAPAMVAVAIAGPAAGYHLSQVIVSTAALVFGVVVFWTHGGRQLTAAGVYSLASACFVGIAGLWWADRDGSALPGALFAATLVTYLTHVAMYFLFWRGTRSGNLYRPLTGFDADTAARLTRMGLGSVVLGCIASVVLPGLYMEYEGLVFAGVIMIALGVAARPGRLSLVGLALVGLGIAAYGAFVFTGYGRLTMVALACGAGVVLCGRLPGQLAKLGMLAGAPLALLALDAIRHDAAVSRHGLAAARADEPDSWATPVELFSQLLNHSTPFEHGHGSSFLATLLIPFPRMLWPEKPVQFGADLVEIFQPSALNWGQSLASLTTGEWYFNFGLTGLFAMVFVIGFGIRWLDRRMSAVLAPDAPGLARVRLLIFGLIVTAVAGLTDLVWNGSSTFTSRTEFRGAVFVGLIFLITAGRRQQTEPVESEPVGSIR